MAKEIKKTVARKKNSLLAVDVWRTQFGPVSVRAVYAVFATVKGIEPHNMKRYTFSHCLNTLRALENPDYVPPTDKSHSQVETN